MGSLEKIVKLACKPKAAPPKSKVCVSCTCAHRRIRVVDMTPRQYLEPIIAATWDEDGAVSDVCRALQPRFREPNAIVRARPPPAPAAHARCRWCSRR
jgi:hypothetical protein